MIEQLLKELGAKGYEIVLRYEYPTNSIIIQITKGPYTINRRLSFYEFYYGRGSQKTFDFNAFLIIREMVQKMEKDMIDDVPCLE